MKQVSNIQQSKNCTRSIYSLS